MSGQDVGFFGIIGGGLTLPDLVIENGDLKADNGLETAVLISLFSDKVVQREDLPEGETEVRGWWADNVSTPNNDLIGSKLWTLDRVKTSLDTESALEDFAKESLAWMIEDGIAKNVTASASRVSTERIDLSVVIIKPDGDDIPFKFIWDGQELRASKEI